MLELRSDTLSFDGFGINGPDEYRSRVATLTAEGQRLNVGPLLASAPYLLRELKALRDEYTRLANTVDACAHDWDGMYFVDDAIAKAEAGQ
jgi:hypothetical protein